MQFQGCISQNVDEKFEIEEKRDRSLMKTSKKWKITLYAK